MWQVSELAEVLAKCRSISDHFWRTIDGERQLKSSQEELGLPQKKLKLDCADRWNSTVETPSHYLFVLVVIIFVLLFTVYLYLLCIVCTEFKFN